MKQIYKSTRLTSIGRKEIVRIANMAFRWCRTNMGVNRRKKYQPAWYIRKSLDDTTFDAGEYDAHDNEIYIYWNNCETVEDLIVAIVHEWTHQLQPILTKYDWDSDYHTNPYEVEARRNEKIWGPQCWNALKQKLNKKPKRNGISNK